MAATCPTCERTIDAVRAPVVRVVGSRVLSYCSTACADSAAAGAAASASASIVAPAPGPATSSATATPALPATSSSAALPPAAVHPESSSGVAGRRRRRNRVVALCGATIAGGMAIAILQAVSPSTPSRVDAAVGAATPAPRPAAAPEPLAPETLRTRAGAELRALLASPSPRVQRIAATALARTRDAAALAALAQALTVETSEITRLDIGYALGRGGDPRGVAALTRAMTTSSRRDVKADAASMLLQLGDRAGVPMLQSLLDERPYRLGAAEVLAAAGDQAGIDTLTAVRADAASAEDERLRASIALGKGGHDPAGIRDVLRGALTDGRYNVGAAAALARLGDPAAMPALSAQLAVPSLRVGAAVSLRRLNPELDARPLLPALAAALGADRDVATVSAAEAILVLTGPAELAEHD